MKKTGLKNVFQGTAWFLKLRQKYPQLFFGFVLAVGTVTVGIALLAYAYLGTFSRYYADDYCLSGLVLAAGLPKALVITYHTWSIHYAEIILVSLSELFGRTAIRFWTAVTLALWVPVLTWVLFQASRLIRLNFSKWMALVLAGIVVFFTVMESPQLFQTLFWRIGLLAYTLSLVFLTFVLGLILNGVRKAMEGNRRVPGLVLGLIACFALTLFAGGFSETYVTLQTGLLGLVFLLALLGVKGKTKRDWLLWAGVSLAGSLIAMLIVISAPGNAVRQGSMPSTTLGIIELLHYSLGNAFTFMYLSLRDYSFQTTLLFLLSILLAYGFVTSNVNALGVRPSQLVLVLLLAPVIAYLLITAVCAPSVYAQSSYPEPRTLIDARYIMVLLISVEGLILGIGLGQLHKLANEAPTFFLYTFVMLVSIAILFYPLYDARKIYAQAPEYRARAIAWDRRDTRIRSDKALGLENIVVQEFDSISLIQEMSSDANFWVNGCAAQFYGVRTIEAKSP